MARTWRAESACPSQRSQRDLDRRGAAERGTLPAVMVAGFAMAAPPSDQDTGSTAVRSGAFF
jgi:hypothetical protein